MTNLQHSLLIMISTHCASPIDVIFRVEFKSNMQFIINMLFKKMTGVSLGVYICNFVLYNKNSLTVNDKLIRL